MGPEDTDRPPQEPSGRLRTTRPEVLVVVGLVGLVAGWAVRPLMVAWDAAAPRISVVQVGAVYLVALILLLAARATHKALQRHAAPMRAHEAVNRLVLAKSCALVGALALGGYLGYALTWVGVSAELASQRIVGSLVAALGAALIVTGALLLERACRVSDDEDRP